MTTNDITLIIFLCFWPIWLGWEIYLLIRRGQGTSVSLISGVARDRGWQLNGVVYVYCGLAAHFWWNWHVASVWGTIAFWVLAVGRLVGDIVLFRLGPIKVWHRNPLIWAVIGILAGHFLFPQVP